jgi:hypothetical protein
VRKVEKVKEDEVLVLQITDVPVMMLNEQMNCAEIKKPFDVKGFSF